MATRNYAIMMTLAVFSDPKTRSISVPQCKNGQVPLSAKFFGRMQCACGLCLSLEPSALVTVTSMSHWHPFNLKFKFRLCTKPLEAIIIVLFDHHDTR
jgi:hypothetical protein